MPHNIILVGSRCTGKTTVGRLLAERLGWPFADVDDHVEAAAGRTVTDIFAAEGEPGFRAREAAALEALAARTGWVIATGGGAVLRETNRRVLKTRGFVVWLTAAPETLWERLRCDPATASRRPNLTATGGADEVKALAAARAPLYREIADFVGPTDALSPEAVAAAILTAWTSGPTSPSSSGACSSPPSG
jgi:shikimate kinase